MSVHLFVLVHKQCRIMKLFKDIFTGKEVFTDAYKVEKVDDIYYKVHGEFKVESNEIDESKLGANKSAEEASEDADVIKVVAPNIISAGQLGEHPIISDKKSYKSEIKKYVNAVVNKVKETDAERATFLKENLPTKFVQPMLKNLDQLSFYVVDEDYDLEGPIIHFQQDGEEVEGTKCWIMLLIDGLSEENL